MTNPAYTPQPGTIPAKVIAYLRSEASNNGRMWIPLAELEEVVDQTGLSPYLVIPIKHGVVQKRWLDGNRRLTEYALGDGKPLPTPEDHEPDEPVARYAPITLQPAIWPPAPTTPGDTAVAPRKPVAGMEYADIDSMQITDDPITSRTNIGGDKYSPLFAKMKPGQSIKCHPKDAPKVAGAMRKWVKDHRPGAMVRAVRRYPKDNMGRVWLLAPAKGK